MIRSFLIILTVSVVALASPIIDKSNDGIFLSALDNGMYLVVYRLEGEKEYNALMGKPGQMKLVKATLNSVSPLHMGIPNLAIINVSIDGVSRNLKASRGEEALAAIRDINEWAALQASRPHYSGDMLYVKQGPTPTNVKSNCKVVVKKITDEVKSLRQKYYQRKFDKRNGF